MKIENEILAELQNKNLYGQNLSKVADELSKNLNIKMMDALKVMKELSMKKLIKVEDGNVKKAKKDVIVTEKEIRLDGTTKIGTIIKADGKDYVKLRGMTNTFFEIANDKEVQDSIGRTCLVDINLVAGKMLATVRDVFGFSDDPISENVAIASKYGFTNKFGEDVLLEASKIPQDVTEEQRKDRVNLEHIPFVTIDPEGCKDKDDAIYDEPTQNGFKVYIAIADVSSGVAVGSQLDKEAFKRGNSAYLGGGVYPMLPPELSNGIFSLDEGKPRLALVVSAEVTNDGRVLDVDVQNAVINVKKSYSYPEAEKTFLSQDGYELKNEETKPLIDELYKNSKTLEKMLSKMLHLDSHEPAYKFSKDGKDVEEITLSNEEYSHKVVESRMILANEIVARFFRERSLTGIFRTHEASSEFKLQKLQNTLEYYGIKTKIKPTTASYKRIVEEIKNHPARDFLMGEVCKSLEKAQYVATDSEVAHFGIGITNDDYGYMHFTSPIRRYADLMTHRMLKDIMRGKVPSINPKTLERVANHLTVQEKNASRAERESDEYLACLWAEKHIGEIQKGYISEIEDDYIKVMAANGTVPVCISIANLPDAKNQNYQIGEYGMKMFGRTKKFAMGETIDFKIQEVDVEDRNIYGSAEDKKPVKIETETL